MIMAWSLAVVEMKEALKSILQYQYDHLGDVKHLKSFVREKKTDKNEQGIVSL